MPPLPWPGVSPSSDPAANASLDAGDLLGGRYELVRRIAKGGMAEVWEAEDTVLTRPVAVKVLLPHLAADDAFLTRFRREAVAAARLSHSHIVSIYDTCADDDFEAIVMELVRGRTLREALDQRGPLGIHHALDIAVQAADALAHAHEHGLVHRDVKPGNILLSDDGRVLVTDFGIAKAAEATSDLTEVGQVVGTAKYLSPEQVQGAGVDARSDVYALGVVLYEMLCGRAPFQADNATATALARLTTDPLRPRQVRAGIPRAVEDIVLKAMARHPEHRYPSATALRTALLGVDLSRIDDGGDLTSLHDPVDPTPQPDEGLGFARRERSWLVPATLIIVIAVTLGLVGVLVGRSDVGDDLFGDGAPPAEAQPTVLPLGQATSFDPPSQGGDDEENDGDLGALTDGDPSTQWRTDLYGTPDLGGLKPGVGVVVSLAQVRALRALQLDSPTAGWTAEVYVADEPAPTLEGWGSPVATVSGGGEVQLAGAEGRAVLVWITDLGPERRVTLGEIRLLG